MFFLILKLSMLYILVMTTYKFLIIEDDDSDFSRLKQLLDDYASDNHIDFKIFRCNSGEEFNNNLEIGYDLAFFDIDLKDCNGIDLSKKLRSIDKNVGIVFITNLAQFAIKGYEVDALDFIVKPVAYYDFYLKMQKILSRVKKKGVELIISNQNDFIKINSDDLMYVEIRHHSISYHLKDKVIQSYGTLKELEEKLDRSLFVRCNSCFLVNLDYVTGIDGYEAIVGNERLQISHPKKKDFLRAVNDHYNGTL